MQQHLSMQAVLMHATPFVKINKHYAFFINHVSLGVLNAMNRTIQILLFLSYCSFLSVANASDISDAKKESKKLSFVNSIGIKMRFVPEGVLRKGSKYTSIKANYPANTSVSESVQKLEAPKIVKINDSFYLGETEVTNRQFQEFIKATGYSGGKYKVGFLLHQKREMSGYCAPDQPVTCVSWKDAQAFCDWLSKKENKLYRLPSSEEWEYACKGSKKGLDYKKEVLDSLPEYAWSGLDSVSHPQVVAKKKPNEAGFYDMLGNVWEWTRDIFPESFFQDKVDPYYGREIAKVRGGCYDDSICRCSAAFGGLPVEDRFFNTGFRVLTQE
jgi:formylglycine-generating enzyme required for sulfatase activity